MTKKAKKCNKAVIIAIVVEMLENEATERQFDITRRVEVVAIKASKWIGEKLFIVTHKGKKC